MSKKTENDNQNTFYVYGHFLENGSVFYVGKGRKRRAWHTKKSRSQFWSNVAKKGFIVKVLFSNLSENKAFELEKELIAQYGRRDLGTGTLVNMTNGGEGHSEPSPETRNKLSLAAKGHKRNLGKPSPFKGKQIHSQETRSLFSKQRKENRYSLGNIISDETRNKLSKKLIGNTRRKGKTMSEQSRQRISQSNKGKQLKPVYCVETGEIFKSLSEASDITKISISSISSVCSGRHKSVKGLSFIYMTDGKI